LTERLRRDPGFDVNMDHGDGVTLLHIACWDDSSSAVIPLLLAHPDIDVNVKDSIFGEPSCVREMLKDPRVKVNEPDNRGITPLWWIVFWGHLDIIRWWIASGREMDLGTPRNIRRTDAIGAAEERDHAEVVTLLERFMSDTAQTRHAMRVELAWYDDLAAGMFALVVFVSDGLLQINDTTTRTPAARFFSIVAQLPLELQMVLCYRLIGSAKEIIPGKESEVGFKELARRLW